MQRWIPILAIVLCLQIIAAIAMGLHNDRLSPAQPNTLLVSADLKAVDRLVIHGPASESAISDKTKAGSTSPTVELVKQNGRWVLPGYFDAPADESKVKGLLDQLASVKRGHPVATTADALERFNVTEGHFERRLIASVGGKPVTTIFLGNPSGLRKTDARTEQDKAVYAVEIATYDIPIIVKDWLDDRLVAKDPSAIEEIEIASSGEAPLTLKRTATATATATATKDDKAEKAWQAQGLPANQKFDETQVAALANAISSLRINAVLGKDAKPEWLSDEPALKLTLKEKDGKPVTWNLLKVKSGEMHILKTSEHPWYVEIDSAYAQALLDSSSRDKLSTTATPTTQSSSKTQAPMSPKKLANQAPPLAK